MILAQSSIHLRKRSVAIFLLVSLSQILLSGQQGFASSIPVEISNETNDNVRLSWICNKELNYSIQRSSDSIQWEPVFENIFGHSGNSHINRRIPSADAPAFYRVVSTPRATGHRRVIQTLDDFEWLSHPDPKGRELRGYQYSGRLAADRGDSGGGQQLRYILVKDGHLRAVATTGTNGTSWVGRWYSTSRTALETNEVLNFAAPLPHPIAEEYQTPIVGIQVIARGSGRFKIELKGPQEQLLRNWSASVETNSFVTHEFEIAAPSELSNVKLINLVVDSPSDLDIGEINLVVSVPEWLYSDPLRYALVTTYGALLRAYDPYTGRTRDHTHHRSGDFDSIPACGFQALAAAACANLGIISTQAARPIIERSIHAIASVPKHYGLLPHWMVHGEAKDFSTVDSAITLMAALGASWIHRMPHEAAVIEMIDDINWGRLTNALNEVSHGYTSKFRRSPYVWTDWGAETYMVQLLRLMQSPTASLFRFDTNPPVHAGRGFIMELGALFAPQLGHDSLPDKFGVSFRNERLTMLERQRAYFTAKYPGSIAARKGLFGLSPIETIDSHANSSYAELGIGSPAVAAQDAEGWLSSHYGAMAASVDLSVATNFLNNLCELGVLQPLVGLPEGVKAGNAGHVVERWHSAQISLNSAFSVLGLYHAVRMMDGGNDVIYEVARTHPRLHTALDVLFPPTSNGPEDRRLLTSATNVPPLPEKSPF
jgi:hypothetical protein